MFCAGFQLNWRWVRRLTIRFRTLTLAVLVALLVVSCISNASPTALPATAAFTATATPTPPSGGSLVSTTTGAFAVTDNTWTDSIDPTKIPLGDGHVSSTPKVGYIDSCTSAFRGGGAEHAGPWLNTANGTWNETAKPAVSGAHTWSDASFKTSVSGSSRTLATNDLPLRLPTGTFPISPSDPAYQYDHNPNSIAPQIANYSIAANPTAASVPSCTGLGPIGVTIAGVFLFNGLDAAGRDAGAHEIQDSCDGHPNGQDAYHYHSISTCLASGKPNTSLLVGYAFDGYGIYAERNAQDKLPTDADLDACHGRTSTVIWDGEMRTMYHYDVTLEYPYTVGCFHGTPVRVRPPSQS